jgi:hypothetical protein
VLAASSICLYLHLLQSGAGLQAGALLRALLPPADTSHTSASSISVQPDAAMFGSAIRACELEGSWREAADLLSLMQSSAQLQPTRKCWEAAVRAAAAAVPPLPLCAATGVAVAAPVNGDVSQAELCFMALCRERFSCARVFNGLQRLNVPPTAATATTAAASAAARAGAAAVAGDSAQFGDAGASTVGEFDSATTAAASSDDWQPHAALLRTATAEVVLQLLASRGEWRLALQAFDATWKCPSMDPAM